MNASVQTRVLYPLTALVTVNTRQMLFKEKVTLPLLVIASPLALVIFWRVVRYLYPDLAGPMQDPYHIYSIMCATLYMQFLVPLLALFKGMSIFSDEIEEGTMMYLLLRPVPRVVLVVGKYLAYVTTVAILTAFSLVACFVLLATAVDTGMLRGDLPILIKDLWVLILGLASYGAVLMIIGLFFKRPLLASILFFGWDFAAAYVPGSAYRFTIKHYLQSIFPHDVQEYGIAELLSQHPPASLTKAVLVLLTLIIACNLIATVMVKVKEVAEAKTKA